MDLTESQKAIIKSKLTTFENIQQALALFIERKHKGQEIIDFDSTLQTLLDQNIQLEVLKDIVVTLAGIQDLDPKKDNYLSKYR